MNCKDVGIERKVVVEAAEVEVEEVVEEGVCTVMVGSACHHHHTDYLL